MVGLLRYTYAKNAKKNIAWYSAVYGLCLCRSCADKLHSVRMSGVNSPSYRKGKPKCKDCGITISYSRTYCKKCANSGARNYWYGKKLPLKIRKRMSITRIKKKLSKGVNNPNYGKLPKHGNWCRYKGSNLRSTWELAFAKFCISHRIHYRFEYKTFPIKYIYNSTLREGTYTPDFYLPQLDTYIEVKGWWRDDAKAKFVAFTKTYSGVTINVFDKHQMRESNIR